MADEKKKKYLPVGGKPPARRVLRPEVMPGAKSAGEIPRYRPDIETTDRGVESARIGARGTEKASGKAVESFAGATAEEIAEKMGEKGGKLPWKKLLIGAGALGLAGKLLGPVWDIISTEEANPGEDALVKAMQSPTPSPEPSPTPSAEPSPEPAPSPEMSLEMLKELQEAAKQLDWDAQMEKLRKQPGL